jgi:hypothetical protein
VKIDIWQHLFRFFYFIIIIELIGVELWWILTSWDVSGLFIFIVTFVVFFVGTWIIISHKRRKDLPQTDERLQKHFERSILFAGLAGLATLLQVTVVEIITGVNFKAIEIFGVVVGISYVAAAATYLIQNKVR